MQTHSKVRIDILIESPLRTRMAALLEQHEVSGYTIFQALGGRGLEGGWSRSGQIIDVGQRLLFTCILDGARVGGLLEDVFDQMAGHLGYVTTADVHVVRDSKFP